MPQQSTIIVHTFDLFRLNKSADAVGLAPNTIRGFHKRGLNLYRECGCNAVFVSKAELEAFIKQNPIKPS